MTLETFLRLYLGVESAQFSDNGAVTVTIIARAEGNVDYMEYKLHPCRPRANIAALSVASEEKAEKERDFWRAEEQKLARGR